MLIWKGFHSFVPIKGISFFLFSFFGNLEGLYFIWNWINGIGLNWKEKKSEEQTKFLKERCKGNCSYYLL